MLEDIFVTFFNADNTIVLQDIKCTNEIKEEIELLLLLLFNF